MAEVLEVQVSSNSVEEINQAFSLLCSNINNLVGFGGTVPAGFALALWILGTTHQVTVKDNGDGTITLSTPQNLDITSSPTFAGVTISGLTVSEFVKTNASKGLASVATSSGWTVTPGYTPVKSFNPETALLLTVARALGTALDALKAQGLFSA
jgi:hypothetical protein